MNKDVTSFYGFKYTDDHVIISYVTHLKNNKSRILSNSYKICASAHAADTKLSISPRDVPQSRKNPESAFNSNWFALDLQNIRNKESRILTGFSMMIPDFLEEKSGSIQENPILEEVFYLKKISTDLLPR